MLNPSFPTCSQVASHEETYQSHVLTFNQKAPGVLPDVDDTSKGLEALHYLGYNSSAEAVIRIFEGEEHFLTYPGERNPSFSANCNVLIFLLGRDDRTQYVPQITKAVRFLASQAFNKNVKEKWVGLKLPRGKTKLTAFLAP